MRTLSVTERWPWLGAAAFAKRTPARATVVSGATNSASSSVPLFDTAAPRSRRIYFRKKAVRIGETGD